MRPSSSPSIHKQGLHSRTDVPPPGVCEEATRHALGLHTGQVPGDCGGIYIVSLFVDCLRICGCFSLVRACYYQDCIIFTICTLTVTFCSILALKASTCNIVLPRVHIYLILFKSCTGLWFEAL